MAVIERECREIGNRTKGVGDLEESRSSSFVFSQSTGILDQCKEKRASTMCGRAPKPCCRASHPTANTRVLQLLGRTERVHHLIAM